jgi:hypothetical protein
VSDFFPEPREPDDPELDESPQPVWLNPPEDVLPGVVPMELIIGRSEQAVVMLAGLRAFPTGLAMNLAVRTRVRVKRFDLNDEVFDGPYRHDRDDDWRRDRLKWGFELADGRRATNVDPWVGGDPGSLPDHPVLSGGGGGGSDRSVDRDYWLWPLPPAGPLKIVCQWLKLGIEPTVSEIDGALAVAAAARSQPVWS